MRKNIIRTIGILLSVALVSYGCAGTQGARNNLLAELDNQYAEAMKRAKSECAENPDPLQCVLEKERKAGRAREIGKEKVLSSGKVPGWVYGLVTVVSVVSLVGSLMKLNDNSNNRR